MQPEIEPTGKRKGVILKAVGIALTGIALLCGVVGFFAIQRMPHNAASSEAMGRLLIGTQFTIFIGITLLYNGERIRRELAIRQSPQARYKRSNWMWEAYLLPALQGIISRKHRRLHEFTIMVPQPLEEVERVLDAFPSSALMLGFWSFREENGGPIIRRKGEKIIFAPTYRGIGSPLVATLNREGTRTVIHGSLRFGAFTPFVRIFGAVWLLGVLLWCVAALCVSVVGLLTHNGAMAAFGLTVPFVCFLASLFSWLFRGPINHAETKVAQFWRDRFGAEVKLTTRRHSWMIF